MKQRNVLVDGDYIATVDHDEDLHVTTGGFGPVNASAHRRKETRDRYLIRKYLGGDK